MRSAVQELGRARIIGDLPPSRQLPAYLDYKGAAAGGGASTNPSAARAGAGVAGGVQSNGNAAGRQQHHSQQQQQAGDDAMLTDGVSSLSVGTAAESPSTAAAADGGGGARLPSEADALQQLAGLLHTAAVEADGFSGRALRKLPFLAHAAGTGLLTPCSCAEFLGALRAAAARERLDRSELTMG